MQAIFIFQTVIGVLDFKVKTHSLQEDMQLDNYFVAKQDFCLMEVIFTMIM